jgi:hypothetical protein
MNTSEEKQLTLSEAKQLLENAIRTLAHHAVQSKHVTNYIEQLEQYISALEKEEATKNESEAK